MLALLGIVDHIKVKLSLMGAVSVRAVADSLEIILTDVPLVNLRLVDLLPPLRRPRLFLKGRERSPRGRLLIRLDMTRRLLTLLK